MTNQHNTQRQLNEMDARMKRIETRLCRLMIALDVDPNRGPDEPTTMQPPRDYTEPHPDDAESQKRSEFSRGLLAMFSAKN